VVRGSELSELGDAQQRELWATQLFSKKYPDNRRQLAYNLNENRNGIRAET